LNMITNELMVETVYADLGCRAHDGTLSEIAIILFVS
jgi:hypothetical protein